MGVGKPTNLPSVWHVEPGGEGFECMDVGGGVRRKAGGISQVAAAAELSRKV